MIYNELCQFGLGYIKIERCLFRHEMFFSTSICRRYIYTIIPSYSEITIDLEAEKLGRICMRLVMPLIPPELYAEEKTRH